ncbi:unnamed protein product [Rhizophagus irregularis]|nr:unnamed protein product [Rhizophagus irregularis]
MINLPKFTNDNGYFNTNIESTFPKINSTIYPDITNISTDFYDPFTAGLLRFYKVQIHYISTKGKFLSKHRAKLTTILLQKKCPRVLDWSSYSPDLNPIENLWAIIKKKSEWDNLNPDLLSNLCACMKKRLEEVIERRDV